MNHFYLRIRTFTLLVFSLFALSATGDEEGTGDELLATYQGYLEALSTAESFDELLPYLPARIGERISEVPPEQVEGVLAGIKGQLPDAMPENPEVFAVNLNGDEAELVLRAYQEEGPVRRTREAGIDFILEADGWKLQNSTPTRWSDVEMLPLSLDDPPTDGSPGPGATPMESIPALTDYALVLDELERRDGWSGEMSVLFDPRGRWVAVINNRQQLARFIDLDSLEELWAGKIYGSTPGVSLRHDGRALVVWGESRGPAVVPVLPHLDERAPSERNYFTRPDFARSVAAVEPDVYWRDAAYHPDEPILALATDLSDGSGVLAFQPVGDGLWLQGERAEATAWKTEALPTNVAWSPSGDVIAHVRGYSEPGVPVVLRAYPDGEVLHELGRPGFAFQTQPLFSPDGTHIVVGGWGGNEGGYTIWNVGSGEELGRVSGTAMKVMTFTPDGAALLGTGETEQPSIEKGLQDTIFTVPLTGGTPEILMQAFPPDERDLARAAIGLAFSPNARYFVAAGRDGQLRIWDALGSE